MPTAFAFCAGSWFAHPAPLCDRLSSSESGPSCGVDACVLLPIRRMDGWVWVGRSVGVRVHENPSHIPTLWKHILATCSLDRSYSDIEFIERIWKCYACLRVECGNLPRCCCMVALYSLPRTWLQEFAPSTPHDWGIFAIFLVALTQYEFNSIEFNFLDIVHSWPC